MAAEPEAYALAAVSQAPEPFRRMLLAVFGGRPGITKAGDWLVTQRAAGVNMSVDVAAGTGLVLGSESATQGGYFCQSTSVTNVTITAANVTNPRRDLIVARIRDNQYATGPTSAFTIEVITGTAAASPVDPTVGANCLVLARVAVAANATTLANAVITDLRTITTGQTRASALGGIVVCTSTARPTVNLSEGQVAYETDTDRVIVYNGSAWIGLAATTMPPPQFFAGSVANGTQTGAFANFLTQNSILVAPYPLTMVVTITGDLGSNAGVNLCHMQITDEAGTAITHGGTLSSAYVAVSNTTGTDNKTIALSGRKDYTAGQTCGFRWGYRIDTSNIYISGTARVDFMPKVS